ncbi:unnamed protein product [Schistosoma margrebowiei]|uniref:Uncharacterized protein n=1 Tax=Schistosoma margrebowiei TaxID=48269 RepID=A0A183MTN4_9TREM|nr:unnamed protein product [Schistosoma margrebowiei]
MKCQHLGGKHGIQWTARMKLDDLDFADDLFLVSHTCVAAASIYTETKARFSDTTQHTPIKSHLTEKI